jgi:hypothetical protein
LIWRGVVLGLLKVSLKPFQRLGGAAALGGRARKREILQHAFLFCQAFFFALPVSKKKAGER